MKLQINNSLSVTLQMTAQEARWLHEQMSNPLQGQDLCDESQIDAKLRRDFFEITKITTTLKALAPNFTPTPNAPVGNDYWVVNGASSTYDLRQEIQKWGGFFVGDAKCWRINNLCVEDPAYRVLKAAGLNFERVKGHDL